MRLTDTSAKTWNLFSLGLLLLALLLASPTASFFLCLLALLPALVVALFAAPRLRCLGLVLLAVAVIAAFLIYPAFTRDYGRYRAHVRAAQPPSPSAR